jgi:preprotein translocase subunit SecG
MVILLTVIHVIVCLFLVIVVLLQSGKAADLAGAFGGMGSQTVFGPRGSATVLSKATTIAAALFMVTSLSLSIMSTRAGRGNSTLLDGHKPVPVKTQPTTPGQGAPQPGSTVPIQVETHTDGGKPVKQEIQAPVVGDPTKQQKSTKPPEQQK